MPSLNLIFQGKSKEINHLDVFKDMITSANDIEKIIISSAFVRSEGIELLKDLLKDYYDKVFIYLGVRNGITSIQSLLSATSKKMNVYTIDTASPAIIYHPKIFGVKSSSEISFLIGSANLTTAGLLRNIEASFHYKDTINEDSTNLWNQYEESLLFLRDNCSDNVKKITSYKMAYEMYLDGLLINEQISIKPKIDGVKKRPTNNITKAIKINTKTISRKKSNKRKSNRTITQELNSNEWVLLWEVSALTERDLNIPSGPTTHLTGDMNFKKGLLEDIDQRHYFRDVIFNNLSWSVDSTYAHLERAFSNFMIIIKGVNYGIYELRITHNTDKESSSYKQNNCMTKLRWGDVRSIIANRDLLECHLKMYKPQNNDSYYILEFT